MFVVERFPKPYKKQDSAKGGYLETDFEEEWNKVTEGIFNIDGYMAWVEGQVPKSRRRQRFFITEIEEPVTVVFSEASEQIEGETQTGTYTGANL